VILVGGFNTALDKLADVDAIEPGAVTRMRNVRTLPGGKGLHVALACATLGVPATLVGLIDAASETLFESTLTQAGARFVGIRVGDAIRTCLALHDTNGRTTELLEPGPDVPPAVAADLIDTFRRESNRARFVTLSGSLPPGLPTETYANLIRDVGGERVLLDTSGSALEAALEAAPFLVKPNRTEAAQIVGSSIASPADAARAAAAIGSRGSRCVVVSLGADGAVIWKADRTIHVTAPAAIVRNPVGAGDCLLAGFAVALRHGWPFEQCGRFAVACGTAKVGHPETGMLSPADVEDVLRAVRVATLEP
jgi:1-phosphofructokinase family hexose kinase